MRSRFQEEASVSTGGGQPLSSSPFAPREKNPSAYSHERSQLSGKSGPLPSSEKPLFYLPQEPDVAITDEETSILGKLMAPNCISEVFEQFLGPYVLLERRNLEEMLFKCVGSPESRVIYGSLMCFVLPTLSGVVNADCGWRRASPPRALTGRRAAAACTGQVSACSSTSRTPSSAAQRSLPAPLFCLCPTSSALACRTMQSRSETAARPRQASRPLSR